MIAGFVSTGSPTKRKDKEKMIEEDEEKESYKAEEVKIMSTCFVDKGVLNQQVACVFQVYFLNKEKKKCTYIAMPDTFERVHKTKEYMDVFKRVGLDGYFNLPPCGIDLQRSYELMSSLNEDGVARVTGLDGEEVEVKIDEALINEALHFKTTGAVTPAQINSGRKRPDLFGA